MSTAKLVNQRFSDVFRWDRERTVAIIGLMRYNVVSEKIAVNFLIRLDMHGLTHSSSVAHLQNFKNTFLRIFFKVVLVNKNEILKYIYIYIYIYIYMQFLNFTTFSELTSYVCDIPPASFITQCNNG